MGMRVNVRTVITVSNRALVGVVFLWGIGVAVVRITISCALARCNRLYADGNICQIITIAIKTRICVDSKRMGFS
jgi:hypothetical protein